MAKQVMFVDIDGVMADSMVWWLTLYNYYNKTNFKKEDVTEWDTRACLKADISPYFNDYTMVKPVEGALGAVYELSRKYRIVFATMGNGENWIRMYYPNAQVIKCQDKSLLRGEILIDDNPMNLDVFVGERFLLTQPWNRNRGLNETTWNEIVSYLR